MIVSCVIIFYYEDARNWILDYYCMCKMDTYIYMLSPGCSLCQFLVRLNNGIIFHDLKGGRLKNSIASRGKLVEIFL